MLKGELDPSTLKGQLSAYQKGLIFERAFGEVMRTRLGFHVRQREIRRGGATARGYECDLVGTKGSGIFSAFFLVGLPVGFVTCNRYLGEYIVEPNNRDLEDAVEMLIATNAPGLLPVIWAALAALATALLYFGARYGRLDVLVECRDRKNVVLRDDIHEVSGRVQDMREDKTTRPPDEVWVVSSLGFDQDALTLASVRGIHCIRFRPNNDVGSLTGEADQPAVGQGLAALAADLELMNPDLPSRIFRSSSWTPWASRRQPR